MWMLPVASGLVTVGTEKMPLEPTVVSGPPDFTQDMFGNARSC